MLGVLILLCVSKVGTLFTFIQLKAFLRSGLQEYLLFLAIKIFVQGVYGSLTTTFQAKTKLQWLEFFCLIILICIRPNQIRKYNFNETVNASDKKLLVYVDHK